LAPPHMTTESDTATAGSAVAADTRSHRGLRWRTGPVAFCDDPPSNISCTFTPLRSQSRRTDVLTLDCWGFAWCDRVVPTTPAV
jgi:hypothetical protein